MFHILGTAKSITYALDGRKYVISNKTVFKSAITYYIIFYMHCPKYTVSKGAIDKFCITNQCSDKRTINKITIRK